MKPRRTERGRHRLTFSGIPFSPVLFALGQPSSNSFLGCAVTGFCRKRSRAAALSPRDNGHESLFSQKILSACRHPGKSDAKVFFPFVSTWWAEPTTGKAMRKFFFLLFPHGGPSPPQEKRYESFFSFCFSIVLGVNRRRSRRLLVVAGARAGRAVHGRAPFPPSDSLAWVTRSVTAVAHRHAAPPSSRRLPIGHTIARRAGPPCSWRPDQGAGPPRGPKRPCIA